MIDYDNERPKGDHRHGENIEAAYDFESPEKLLADFFSGRGSKEGDMMRKMMRSATIRIRKANDALSDVRAGFLAAWKSGEYAGEHFDFESPAALFRVLTPKRWELIECLQKAGPLGVRALARALGRDVKRVHGDATGLIEADMVEKTPDGKLAVPFAEIRADFVMKSAA